MDLFVKNFQTASSFVQDAIKNGKKEDELFMANLEKYVDSVLLEHIPTSSVNRIKKKPRADCGQNISGSSNTSAKPNSPSPAKAPVRTKRNAASKAERNLKEQSLSTKMRNDTSVIVKEETIRSDVTIKREKKSLQINNYEFKKPLSPSQINDESIMILAPTDVPATIELTDEDDDDRMPPPPVPQQQPPRTKRTTRTKSKRTKKQNKKSGVPEPKIKSERESTEDANFTAEVSKANSNTINEIATNNDEIDTNNAEIGTNNDNAEVHTNNVEIDTNNDEIDTEVIQLTPHKSILPAEGATNSTFVKVVPGNYKIITNEFNETFDIQPKLINLPTDNKKTDEPSQSNKKNKHELFNPCIQSPVIKKVQAFEQHAHKMQSPLAPQTEISIPAAGSQRQTRTKTRAKVAAAVALAENTEPEISDKTYSASTKKSPSPKKSIQASLLPTKIFTTPVSVSALKIASASAPHCPKEQRSTSVTRSASSREHSAEDVKRGLQLIADEKKRKREEKLKQVQQQREANEKEKLERFKRQQMEKEEKQRQELEKKRLAKEAKEQEAEQRRQQKLLAVQEKENQKREQMAIEAAEAAERKRQRNEIELKILAEKNAMQKKLNDNFALKKDKFTFDMLQTDDETDDENDHLAANKAKRPPPPNWCLPGQRDDRIASQSHLISQIYDEFFSTCPMTVNLKEVFPDITQKHLNRNSSAVWNTPPRYSSIDFPRY